MQYQIFVESLSEEHFVASVVGMPSILVEANTEVDAVADAKIALASRLAKGKLVTIDFEELKIISNTDQLSMKNAGILQEDPTFDDWIDKLASIRRSANIKDDII